MHRLTLATCIFLSATAAARDIDFNRDVRPILSNKCLLCHGPDEEGLEAGLRLDDRSVATSELESGTVAIVPGRPEDSELITRIATNDEDLRMPPADHGARLTDGEIEILTDWIRQGAKFARHWAYVTPARPQVPEPPSQFADWPVNEVDHFTLQRMVKHNLTPSECADRYALVRRVFLDLTGLPPSIEEADAFVNSRRDDAYEHLVDDLLQRPSFGEHWARKWLDLARYADSAGYADDPPRTIWAYRDWVIRAINNNMPFDRFTTEQLAGDLLPNASEDQIIATAFHRNTLTNNEGGTQDEEFRNVAVVDRVNTTMAVWMGTTMACAQCHTHKYDPITQDEYFRFFAIFNNTQDADRRDESPVLTIFSDEQKRRRSELEQEIAGLKQILQTATPELATSQLAWEKRLRADSTWTELIPVTARRSSGLKLLIEKDGTIAAEEAAEQDTYEIDVTLNDQSPDIAALQLVTVPHQELPAQGAGHGNGNFVVTGVQAQLVPEQPTVPRARFVRITNRGQRQILSLAEVEVLSGGKNVAVNGKARQESTDYNAPAALAIDGNTDGDFQKKSVTHTNQTDNPWWEVDLKSEQAIDSIVVWNRTGGGIHERLNDFDIELFDSERNSVWRTNVQQPPNPSARFLPSGVTEVAFASAVADFHQPQFEPADVLTGGTGAQDGWAVGGDAQTSHHLTLIPREPITDFAAVQIRITIEQQSPHTNHVLGRFRLQSTADRTAIERSRLPREIVELIDRPVARRTEDEQLRLAAYYRREVAPELSVQRKQLVAAQKELTAMKPATSVPVLRELTDNRRQTHLQFRGNYLDKGHILQPGLPAVFPPAPKERPLDRLALAQWLTSPDNPLTARVLANRYWETIFGRGIVVTSEEFGSQGELPSHPELLDWLATEIIANGWDRKAFLRTLVTSATYRQTAAVTPEKDAADPDNRWLSRGPRVRLSAEMVRDQALFASGLLSPKMYGPPVNPPQPDMGLKAAFGSSTDWKTSTGEDRYRRGIYTTWRRSNPYPSMATFDAPNREVCTVRRNRTNTPLQSLVTLNDPVYVEAAQALARKTLAHEESVAAQLTLAFRCCLQRPPTDAELSTLHALFKDSRKRLEDQAEEALKLSTAPLGPLPEHMDRYDAAAMTVVCNVLLNLDEMFLKR